MYVEWHCKGVDRCSLTFNDRYFQRSWAKANRIGADDCISHPTSPHQSIPSCESDPVEPQSTHSFTLFLSPFLFLSLSKFLASSQAFALFTLCLLQLRYFTLKGPTVIISERLSEYHPVQDRLICSLLVYLMNECFLADGCSDTGLALPLIQEQSVLVVEIFEISLFCSNLELQEIYKLLQL